MNYSLCTFTAVITLVSLINFGNSYRILAICPRASISHQVVLRGLTLALNKRGHELVVVTTDPVKDNNLKNYTEIDISFLYKWNYVSVLDMDANDWLSSFPKLSTMTNIQTDLILDYPEVKELYAPHSRQKFDIILLELVYWPALLPLAKRFDAPVIGFTPMGLSLNVHYTLGNPILTSHPSNWDLYTPLSEAPSFYKRLTNFISFWRFTYYYGNVFTPSQEAIARKYFGDDIPDLNELEKNVSLVFVNQQIPISFVRPNVPKIIGISGFHVEKKIDPLPKNLQKILDAATEGFVYMSLGSNMKSSMLPNKTLNDITAVFSELPYTVLWKFETEVLSGQPENVHIMKWLPQQAVLAHPNLKVFIYQGGLQSTEEAVTHAVPLVGLPTWADQKMQVDKMVSLGVAQKLDLRTIDRYNLKKAIVTVATEKSYKDNMRHLRELLDDNSHDLLENAIWWTEHVIRHRGAPHLHCSTADDPWYRRQDMDLVAFISASFTVILGLLLVTWYRLSVKFVHLIAGAGVKNKLE